jgi:hypothetical protein
MSDAVIDLTASSPTPNTIPLVSAPVNSRVGIDFPNMALVPARPGEELTDSLWVYATSGALLFKWLVQLAALNRAWIPNMSFEEFDDRICRSTKLDDNDNC